MEQFVRRVSETLADLPQNDHAIIVIDNCSDNGTRDILQGPAASNPRLLVILNARNYGHIRYPYYAMRQSTWDAVITMASDLQDHPEMIRDFVAPWEQGTQAVVALLIRMG